MTYNRGKGRSYRWLCEQLFFQSDECLTWPFSRKPDGRGSLGYCGKVHAAHVLMCEMAHGPCPPGLECCHSCGNGHLGCVNQKHLSWGTRSENQKDRRKHGTHVTSRYGNRTTLTEEQIAEIRATAGKETNAETAKRFGRHAETIRFWRATTHTPHCVSEEPRLKLRRLNRLTRR